MTQREYTKLGLNDETIGKLQELLQANIDSAEGFREVREKVDDASLEPLFGLYAGERDRQAQELASYIALNEETPKRRGSITAKVHRAWIDARAAVSGNNAHAVLAEAERGEDHIKAAYEDVLKETAGSPMNDVLQRQYASVKSAHDKIKHMRNARSS